MRVTGAFVLACIGLLGPLQFAAGDRIHLVDNSHGNFLKKTPETQPSSAVNVHQIAAAAASLLGLPPLGTIDAATDAQLNTLLGDSPFTRPRAVCAITVTGTGSGEEQMAALMSKAPSQVRLLANSSASQLSQAFQRLSAASGDAAEEIVLDTSRGSLLDAHAIDEALTELALALGGNYERGAESAAGKFTVPGDDGNTLQLDLSQDADYLLATELAHLVRAAKAASFDPTRRQLVTATLSGLQAVKVAYGPQSKTAECATEVVMKTVALVLDSVDQAFEGKMVALLSMFDETVRGSTADMETHTAQLREAATQRRVLLQAGASPYVPGADLVAAYVLANRSVAWGVGILLIIFTIVTVLALVCMPITKDTLLYSRAKID